MVKLRDGDKEFRHESYGMIGFSRITGSSGRMFGSSLPDQHTFIRLRIGTGMRTHSLSRDWFGKDYDMNDGRDYIEVDLSPAQYAELLTTMNVGSGIPCSIRSIDGRGIAECPDELFEVEQIREGFSDTTKELADRMKTFASKMKETFEKKTTITLKDKEDLRVLYGLVVQQVESNMPFVINQFHTAAGKIITQAKSEVDAWVTSAIHAAGIKAISEGKEPALTLPAKKDDT